LCCQPPETSGNVSPFWTVGETAGVYLAIKLLRIVGPTQFAGVSRFVCLRIRSGPAYQFPNTRSRTKSASNSPIFSSVLSVAPMNGLGGIRLVPSA
jgi:hypothetical protein